MTVKDSIEQEIEISAPIERVWTLVSQPGWWINDGAIVEHEVREQDDHVVVVDPTHGEFPLEVVESREPDYVALRWLPRADSDDQLSTLVEFWLETTPNGVRLKVRESGFASGSADDDARTKHYDDNTEGWESELAAARDHLQAA